MLEINEIIRLLEDRNLKKVSELSGVSYQTIRGIEQGNTGKVSYNTIKKLSDYFISTSAKMD